MATNSSNFILNNINFSLDDDTQKRKEIVADVIDRKTTLLGVVESLGNVLTNEDKIMRKRGVELLSWLLTQLPPNFLNDKEIIYFTNFYCDRLKDHHSVIPSVLQGISCLVIMKNINEKSVCDLVHNIFQLVTCQSQVARDRYVVYSIMKSCSQFHTSAMRNIASDFMYGVITSMEGETDPKNLKLIFSFLPKLLQDLQVNHLMIDIFEVFSTYFPVDFTTVEKDGIVITREDLADGLSRCLSAIEQLAVQCIPLIIEKLDSTLKAAKLDSYKLMQRCSERINLNSIEPFLSDLWKLAQRDLLPPVDYAIQEEALLTITSLVGISASGSDSTLNRFLDDIIVGVRSLLNNPTDSLFVPAMRILEATCPQSEVAQKRALLEIKCLFQKNPGTDCESAGLLKAALPFLCYIKQNDTDIIDAVSSYCLRAAQQNNATVRNLAFTSLEAIYGVLSKYDHLRQSVYKLLLTILTNTKESKCLNDCERLLRIVAISNSSEFMSTVMTTADSEFKRGSIMSDAYLFLLAALIDIKPFSNGMLNQYVNLGHQPNHSSAALASLLNCCERGRICEDKMDELQLFLFDLASRSLNECNEHTLAHLLKFVMASRSSQQQIELIRTHEKQLISPIFTLQCDLHKPVVLLEGLLGALRSDVDIPILHQLTPILIRIAMTNEKMVVRKSAARLLAAFINKMPLDYVQNVIEGTQFLSDEKTEFAIELHAWVLKGALLRGLPQLELILAQWFSTLNNPNVGWKVAQVTPSLLQEDTVFLNSSSHCTVRFLFRQRLFCCLPSIVGHMKSLESGSIRDNHLEALVHVAAGVPKEVVGLDERSVATVVCMALLTDRPSVSSPALQLLQTLLQSKATLFSDHITSLLPSLLRLTVSPASLLNRQAALRCLFLAANYPTHLTLPFKSQVVRGLVVCLDDRKRLVRSEAARTRGRWCLVGAVGEEAFLS